MKLNNIKRFKSLFIFCTAALAIASCSLEEIPRDKQVAGDYDSPTDVERGVVGAYTRLRDAADNIYLNLSEVRSDNTWVNPAPNGNRSYSEIGTFRATASIDYVINTWNMLYQVIDAVNTVLEKIDSVDFPQDDDEFSLKDQLMGECHFLRGYAYMELARIYGHVPIVDRVLTIDEVKNLGQSTPQEVFAQAVSDLIQARDLLPDPGEVKKSDYKTDATDGRVDNIAASAMLARTYMQMAGFPINDSGAEALAEAELKTVIEYSEGNGDKYWAPTYEEWRRQFMMDGNNAYSIFAIQYVTGGFGNTAIFNFSPDVPATYYNRVANSIYIFSNDIWVDKSLQYEYTVIQSTGERDKRGWDDGDPETGWTVMNGYKAEDTFQTDYNNPEESLDYGEGPFDTYTRSFFVKFLDTKQKRAALGLSYSPEDGMVRYDDWPINCPVIRLEDMMLLYAEILIGKGQIADGLYYVNRIRQRAEADLVPTGVNATEAMEYVKLERRVELAGEGVRWFDEVRYNEWKEDTEALFDRNGGVQDGIVYSNLADGRYYYPIPSTQMAFGVYSQNTGY